MITLLTYYLFIHIKYDLLKELKYILSYYCANLLIYFLKSLCARMTCLADRPPHSRFCLVGAAILPYNDYRIIFGSVTSLGTLRRSVGRSV